MNGAQPEASGKSTRRKPGGGVGRATMEQAHERASPAGVQRIYTWRNAYAGKRLPSVGSNESLGSAPITTARATRSVRRSSVGTRSGVAVRVGRAGGGFCQYGAAYHIVVDGRRASQRLVRARFARGRALRSHWPRLLLRACHPGLTAVCRKSGDTLKWTAVDQVAAELQDGASAQVAPARARALHALLDEILPEPIGKCRSRRHA